MRIMIILASALLCASAQAQTYSLSPEAKAALDAQAAERAEEGLGEKDGLAGLEVHGEFGVGIGTGGYREAYGVIGMPLGDTGYIQLGAGYLKSDRGWIMPPR